jgi:hypothetical protein
LTTNAASAGDERPPLLAVALLSAAALGCEVLLMRLFSIVQWHHFAYMMISVALLGYGAAGAFVTLARGALLERYAQVFVAAAAAFGATAVASFLLAQRAGFDPLELLWDPQQPLRLSVVYLLLLVPFFCAATAVCATFARFGTNAPRVYGADILGAGAGSLAVVAALFAVAPMAALRLAGAVGLAAAAVAALHCRLHPRVLVPALAAGALLLAFAVPPAWTPLRHSEFKALAQALELRGARTIAERSSPLGVVTIVESPEAPLRHAPGLSLATPVEPPAQLGVFVDGDGPSALTRFAGDRKPLAYLDFLTSAAPYHLLDRPRVLVLGAGAGADVLQALAHDARMVDAVELNPQLVELVERDFAAFSGRPFSAPGVRVHVAEARGFVARHEDRYDLIEVALLDAFGASAAGLYGLAESYLYTVEALETYVERLAPDGMLAITRWVNLPPRDVLKLFATAVDALERRGVGEPGRQLALVRSWSTATLLVKNGAFTTDEIGALREFCRARSFDADYFPGIAPADANRYNVLDASYFHDGAVALLGPARARFVARYKFDLTPATDDRPYFFHFFRWRTLPELLATKAQGGLPLLEWGYPVLIATLAQAALASLVLILLPLAFALRRQRLPVRPSRGVVALYFGAIGFAFMFVEIAFIQKLTLFLAHPLYAIAVVLCAFLVFASVGSRWSARLAAVGEAGNGPRIGAPVVAIALLALACVLLVPSLVRYAMPLADWARVALTVALIAPLAFAMGMPFPLGLARLAAAAEPLVPWAWGVNACASVVAAILATVLAIHFGFVAVVALAVLLYAAAFVVWR